MENHGQYYQELKKETDLLLTQGIGLDDSRRICRLFRTMAFEVSDIYDIKNPSLKRETQWPFGTAISPLGGDVSLESAKRTETFVKGLVDAIKEAQSRFPGEKIRVFYPCCGIYAALANMAITQFEPDEVEIKALDVHEESILSAQKTSQKLGTSDFFVEFITENALEYDVSRWKPHIIVVEAMDYALMQEPQVAIMAHLRRHLIEGGIFLPESIQVSCLLKDDGRERTRDHVDIKLGTLAKLDEKYFRSIGDATPIFADKTFDIPSSRDEPMWAYLETRVRVFENKIIKEDESRITMTLGPLLTIDNPPAERLSPCYDGIIWHYPDHPKQLRVRYRFGDQLGWYADKYKRVFAEIIKT